MKKKIFPLMAFCLFLFGNSISQTPQLKSTKPFYGTPGVQKTISELKQNSLSASSLHKKLDSTSIKPYKSYYKRKTISTAGGDHDILHPERDDSRLRDQSAKTDAAAINDGSTPQIWSNFLAIDFYTNPLGWPPDPNGAVGPSQVVSITNGGINVFEKPSVSDRPLVTPNGYSRVMPKDQLFITLEQFFSSVLPDSSRISDPHIRYDRLSKRWFIVAIEVNPLQENNLIFLAVSDGERITTASAFTFYAFNSSLFPYDPNAPYAPFLDFPTLGIDKNSIVIGGNQFGFDSLTNVGYVINKKKLLHGKLVVYPFELGVANNINGDVSGMYTPTGVHNDDPSAKKSLFAGISYFQDNLVIASLEYDSKGEPRLASEINIPVEPFNMPRDNSHPGSLAPLEQNDTRLLGAAIHTNKITGIKSLWTAHAIGVDQTGHFISGSDSDFIRQARTGSRWYEIGNIYSKPTISQVGTVNDNKEPSGRRADQYFNPTIAANGQGNAVLGGTTDAYNEYLNVFVTGRFSDDPQGTLQKTLKATNTTAMYAPYIDFGGSFFYIGRWGDFSGTDVDPLDDQTMWTFQQYANVDDSYGTRVVQVKAPAPATPLPVGPFYNNRDTLVTLKGKSVEHSGFFDPGKDKDGPGFNRLSVKSTGDVSVSNVNFWSPTEISFKLSTKNKPAGKYFLMITNPDGQIAVGEYTIQAAASTARQRLGAAQPVDINDKVAQKNMVTSDIYPNPTKGDFKLKVKAAADFNGRVLLLTSSGKTISESSFNFTKGSGEVSLSLTNLANGNYLAAVYNSENVLIAVHKIIKQ